MQSLSCALTLALAGVFGQHIREVRRERGQDSELQAALWLMKVRLNTIWLSFYTVLIIAGIALLLQSLLWRGLALRTLLGGLQLSNF